MNSIPCAICCREMCVCTHADMMFPSTFRPDPVKDENHRLRTELAEWKAGKKRIFWRVTWIRGRVGLESRCYSLQRAREVVADLKRPHPGFVIIGGDVEAIRITRMRAQPRVRK